jgi:aspartate/methionine/tyrosine aminotransferase
MHPVATDPNNHLGYGAGPRGSPRLKKALASFFNSTFQAHKPVLENEVLILPRVVAVIDALAWSACNDAEGIIVPVPFYTGLQTSRPWKISRSTSSGVLSFY